MAYQSRRRSRWLSRDDYGRQRAEQHVREAEQLSRELGGTDQDVKDYFFALAPVELNRVFTLYGQKYGSLKKEYAEETYKKWKSGKRRMSGLVASRLYNLLPPLMPLDKKYGLVERLWAEYCPRSSRTLNVGADVSIEDIMSYVTDYLKKTVKEYRVPDPLERRFKWLAQNDVQVRQQLLNHFLQRDLNQALEHARIQIPILQEHLSPGGTIAVSIRKTIKLGKHTLALDLNSKYSGISAAKPTTAIRPARSDHNSKPANKSDWVSTILGVCFWIGLILLIARCSD